MKFLIMYLFLSSASYGNSLTTDLLMKARGLQAKEKLLEFSNKTKNGKPLSLDEKCRFNVETGYANFAEPDAEKLFFGEVKGVTGNTMYFYGIEVREPDGAGVSLIYKYSDKKRSKKVGMTIEGINEKWKIDMPSSLPNLISFSDGKNCNYTFDKNNPLESDAFGIGK